MAVPRKVILELVESIPEEKLGKVISFIKFVRDEEELTLSLEVDDEEEILKVLEEDDWYSSEEIRSIIGENILDVNESQ